MNYSTLIVAWLALLLAIGVLLLICAVWNLITCTGSTTTRRQDLVSAVGLVTGVVWVVCVVITAFATVFYKLYLIFAPII